MDTAKTEIKQDADFISNHLQILLENIRVCATDLERQANKLFGYEPKAESMSLVPGISSDNMPVTDLLKELDDAFSKLRSEANRF